MLEFIRKTLKEHDFSSSEVETILSFYHSICKNAQANGLLQEILDAYERDMRCEAEPINERIVRIAEMVHLHVYSVRLVCILCLSKIMAGYFQENNVSEQLLTYTLDDIRAKYLDTYQTYKVQGILHDTWFFGAFRLERFAFGRLQCHVVNFRLPRYEKDGRVLTDESLVINVHIPQSKIPFTSEECEKSYQMAKEFFAKHFEGDKVPFVCWSWLLYPKNAEILPPDSNIVKFLSRYDIIEMEEYTEAYNPVAQIVFNRECMGDVSTLPKDTLLRKRYAEFLRNGGKAGWGYGVFFL